MDVPLPDNWEKKRYMHLQRYYRINDHHNYFSMISDFIISYDKKVKRSKTQDFVPKCFVLSNQILGERHR